MGLSVAGPMQFHIGRNSTKDHASNWTAIVRGLCGGRGRLSHLTRFDKRSYSLLHITVMYSLLPYRIVTTPAPLI